MATYNSADGSYTNVELKGRIDSNVKHDIGESFNITTPYGISALVSVIDRKVQPGNPMGKYRYLVQYEGWSKKKSH